MMFHFMQTNHYAFDSLFYDGNTQMIALIQITINPAHKLPYEKLIGFIEQNPIVHEYHEKYFRFFGNLKNHLVSTFVFQWMTDQISDYSMNHTGNQIEVFHLADSREFQIYCVHHQLLKAIAENRKY